MNPQVQKPPTPWPLIILFLIFILSALAGGIVFYKYQKETLLDEKVRELSAISDLKVRQISQWRFERIADANFIRENIARDQKWVLFTRKDEEALISSGMMRVLKSLTRNYDYNSAAILDRNGTVKFKYPADDSISFSYPPAVLNSLARSRKGMLMDVENHSESFVHLDVIAPVTGENPNDTTIMGFISLRIDPSRVLYPILRLWPSSSQSAETMIVRKDGDSMIYLSELRSSPAPEKVQKYPATHSRLATSMAVKNISETTDGVDYRNVRVVASMKKIPGTGWHMIAKIDRDEVISGLTKQMKIVFMTLLMFILSIGLFLGFILWNQRVRFYREKYEDELNRLALFTHFDYILKFANDIILLLDNELHVVEANDRALDEYMLTRDELIGKNLKIVQASETLDGIDNQLQKVHDEGDSTFETIHLRKDGTGFPVEISARLVGIEGTQYIQFIGRNITDRKLVEANLRESELRFRKIFEESPFPMVITAKDFGILRANASFCTMTGYKEEELKMHTLSELTYPDDAAEDQLNLMKLVAGDFPVYHVEKRYLRKDGSIILGSSTISIVRNNLDEAQIFIGMIEDITQKKKAEQDLIAAKLKAEESDRLKTAFLHNVSHEIRTPMNAIIGFSSLLQEPDLTEPDRHQYTDIIFQSSNQLLSIINDIVDVANIESGQAILNAGKTDLNVALRNLVGQYSFSKKQTNIPISLTLGLPDDRALIKTDQTKLVQVLSNLINNAIKFTSKGRIDFGYALNDDNLEFYVSDTGIGIPAESLPKIFDRFYQVDRTVSRQFGGTGLGLSICKAYVNLLGGEISVESEPGQGTRFSFTVPFVTVV
jgi:PAS domain S-box-containing protein